jgi:hypothetical protein
VDRDRSSAATAQERRRPADLIDDLDETQLAMPSLCTGWDVKTAGAHLVSYLAEVLAHSGDMRIPLGLRFEPDPHPTATALDFLTGPVPIGLIPLRRMRGIRLQANDIDRAWGKRPEIRGHSAELLMATAGRTDVLDGLDGPGLALLRQRVSG